MLSAKLSRWSRRRRARARWRGSRVGHPLARSRARRAATRWGSPPWRARALREGATRSARRRARAKRQRPALARSRWRDRREMRTRPNARRRPPRFARLGGRGLEREPLGRENIEPDARPLAVAPHARDDPNAPVPDVGGGPLGDPPSAELISTHERGLSPHEERGGRRAVDHDADGLRQRGRRRRRPPREALRARSSRRERDRIHRQAPPEARHSRQRARRRGSSRREAWPGVSSGVFSATDVIGAHAMGPTTVAARAHPVRLAPGGGEGRVPLLHARAPTPASAIRAAREGAGISRGFISMGQPIGDGLHRPRVAGKRARAPRQCARTPEDRGSPARRVMPRSPRRRAEREGSRSPCRRESR